MKVQVIIGSTRKNRFGDKPANWICDLATQKNGIEAELLDLRDYPMPFFNDSASPASSKEGPEDDSAKKWVEKISEADAYIIVTPEYNHGYPAVLKNALDYAYFEWNKKPVGFVSYGNTGGARAVQQLRQVVIELGMAPIRRSVLIRDPWDLKDKNGELKEGALDPYNETADKFLEQLMWWGSALKQTREK
ncbi:MAG: NAD(P)H-dependent oxidoreductase [Candidatus Spechtbacterales bacterium]